MQAAMIALGDLGIELPELLIGLCGGLFHRGERDHQVTVP